MFSILPIDIIDTVIKNLRYHPVELLELKMSIKYSEKKLIK